MTIFTRDFNRNSSYWTAILFYLICGLLLLLMPNLALSIANVALAILLCAVGVRSIVSYLRGSILDGVRTLTGNIVTEMGYSTGLHREALIATGVVLFVFILIINLLFSIIKRKESKA